MSILNLARKTLASPPVVATKESAVQPLVQRARNQFMSFFDLPWMTDINLSKQYKDSLWVYICIHAIARSVASTPIRVYQPQPNARSSSSRLDDFFTRKALLEQERKNQNDTLEYFSRFLGDQIKTSGLPGIIQGLSDYGQKAEGDQPIELLDHPLTSLIYQPNSHQTLPEFSEGIICYLKLRGNAYIEMVGENPDQPPSERNLPVELHLLHPDNVVIIPGKTEFIKGYVYYLTGSFVPFDPASIIHLKYFDPTNPYYGQGVIEAGIPALKAEANAVKWNAKFFENDATPGGVLSTKEMLNETAFQRIKSQWEDKYKGVRNSHKVAILEQGLEYKAITLSPKDADFIKTTQKTREDLMALFGVTPVIAGLDTSNYAVAREQRKVFWEETVIPDQEMIEVALNNRLAPLFGQGIYMSFDRSNVSALHEAEEQKLDKAKTLPLRLNEQRALFGYDTLGEQGEVVLIDSNKMPLEFVTGGEPPASTGKEGDAEEY